MLKTSVLELLRTFSADELRKFSDFVASPYFNKKTPVENFWKILKKYSPAFDNEKLNREIFWNELFPEKNFNYGVMKNLIYELTQLTEKFMSVEEMLKSDYETDIMFLNNLSYRNLEKLLLTKYYAIEKKIDKEYYGPDKYDKLAEIKWLVCSSVNDSEKSLGPMVQEITDYTIYSFLIELFKLYNNSSVLDLNRKELDPNVLFESFLKNFNISSFMESLENYSPSDYKIVSLYYDMYNSLSNPMSSELYYKFKNNVIENESSFSYLERTNFISCLYTALSYNKVILDKSAVLHDLNKLMHERNIHLMGDKYMDIRDYTLSVRIAAMCMDVEFLEMFVNTYTKYIPATSRTNMEIYANAYLYFSKGEFGKALELTNKINFEILTFKFEIKNLQVMLLYELKEFDSLMYALDTFKHYASNNRFVSESAAANILKFTGYVNNIYKLSLNPDKIKIELLINKISSESLVTKNWLLNKLKELHGNV